MKNSYFKSFSFLTFRAALCARRASSGLLTAVGAAGGALSAGGTTAVALSAGLPFLIISTQKL